MRARSHGIVASVDRPGLATEGSQRLERTLESISSLAPEICGECVPREHAPGLKQLMDQIQALSRRTGSR